MNTMYVEARCTMVQYIIELVLSQSSRLNHLQTTCMYAEVSYLVERPPYRDLLRLSLRQEVRRGGHHQVMRLLFTSAP